MLGWFKKRRRRKLLERPFPDAWRQIMHDNVAYVRSLSAEQRKRLEELVVIFIAEKRFEGAAGLEITDEMRVIVATHACILLLNRKSNVYPRLDTVLIYPAAYVADQTRHEGPVVIQGKSSRLGESWTRGLVILSWQNVRRSLSGSRSGHNVVLHEFAHQLDAEDGSMDGAPALAHTSHYRSWARVLGAEYEALSRRLHAGCPTAIDAYAGTSPPEFFAVVTEMFFETPHTLVNKHPELYRQLSEFYQQDPASSQPTA